MKCCHILICHLSSGITFDSFLGAGTPASIIAVTCEEESFSALKYLQHCQTSGI